MKKNEFLKIKNNYIQSFQGAKFALCAWCGVQRPAPYLPFGTKCIGTIPKKVVGIVPNIVPNIVPIEHNETMFIISQRLNITKVPLQNILQNLLTKSEKYVLI